MAQGQVELWQKRDNPDVTLEAVRLNEENVERISAWCGGELVEEIDPTDPEEKQYGINLRTVNGMERASLGMYVVKFGTGFYITHVRLFEEVYEPVSRPAPPPESPADSRRARGFADPFDQGKVGP